MKDNLYLQVKYFNDCTSADSESNVNEFLKEKGSKIEKVTPFWNNILGGIVYVVTYFEG